MLLLKPLSEFSPPKIRDFHLCGLNVQSEMLKVIYHIRVIGTEKWNRVMNISVGYPGTWIPPGTALVQNALLFKET